MDSHHSLLLLSCCFLSLSCNILHVASSTVWKKLRYLEAEQLAIKNHLIRMEENVKLDFQVFQDDVHRKINGSIEERTTEVNGKEMNVIVRQQQRQIHQLKTLVYRLLRNKEEVDTVHVKPDNFQRQSELHQSDFKNLQDQLKDLREEVDQLLILKQEVESTAHGMWGNWGEWGIWRVTGTMTRTRTRRRRCDSPPPSGYGSPCPGSDIETATLNCSSTCPLFDYDFGSCSSNGDCSGLHVVCEQGMCVCDIMYEYDNGQCIQGCSSYGSMFTSYLHKAIRGLNNDVIYGVNSLEACKLKCINAKGFECHTADWQIANHICYLSSAKWFGIDASDRNDDSLYYLLVRNCL